MTNPIAADLGLSNLLDVEPITPRFLWVRVAPGNPQEVTVQPLHAGGFLVFVDRKPYAVVELDEEGKLARYEARGPSARLRRLIDHRPGQVVEAINQLAMWESFQSPETLHGMYV